MHLKAKQPGLRQSARPFAGGKSTVGPLRRGQAGFTFVELMISATIIGMVFAGIINCYIQSGVRVQWTGYSLAAQSLASETLEQMRAGTWDPAQAVPKNDLTNMSLTGASYNSGTQTYTGYTTAVLDVPFSGTNSTLATNFVTVQMINVTTNGQVQLQFIRVDTVWPFYYRKGSLYFTNTVCTMVGPDDRQI
jgi:prepilin-type N-terminal cleavage/methylation domain-containing protein